MSLVCGFPMLAMFFSAATPAGTAPQVVAADVPAALKPYVAEDAAVLVLNHVRVIDGTGAPAALDQRIDIVGGRIERVQNAKLRNALPPNARVLDLSGKTVMPAWWACMSIFSIRDPRAVTTNNRSKPAEVKGPEAMDESDIHRRHADAY